MQTTCNGLELLKNGELIDTGTDNLRFRTIPFPFIEGDGSGRDIWKASQRGSTRRWKGLRREARYPPVRNFRRRKGVPASSIPGCPTTGAAARDPWVSIKGPPTMPVGGGIRSLNVALRQLLDLYARARPVRYYQGVPSPVKHPERVDIVNFRENTEDVYSGIEFKAGLGRCGPAHRFSE